MKMLTYKQAAELLGCSYQAISVAVVEKRLIPVATGRGPRLIEDQVRLFINKRGISDRYLNIEERDKWQECKKLAKEYKSDETEERSVKDILISIDKSLHLAPSLNEKLNNSILLQKLILEKIGAETPKELEGPFPHTPLIQQNA